MAALALLVAAALLLRARGLLWGLPALDEEATPFRKAVEFWGTETGRLTLNPHFYNYPSLTFYLHFLFQGVWWVGGLATGVWRSLDAFRAALTTDPASFMRLARWVNAGVAAATVVPVWLLARRLAGPGAALAAGILLVVNPLHAAQSRFIGTDVPLAFAVAVGLLAISRLAARGTRADYRRAGAWVGLAASCKYPGALLGVPLLAVAGGALLSNRGASGAPPESPGAGQGGALPGRAAIPRLAAAALAAAIAFAATSPFVIVDLPEALRAIGFERFHMATGHFGASGEPAILEYGARTLPRGFGWPGLILAAAALVAALWRRGPARLVALFALAGLAVIGSWKMAADRYVLLVLPALVVLAGWGMARLGTRLTRRSGVGGRVALLAILLAVVAPALANTWKQGTLSARASTRAAAAEWVLRNVPRQSLLAAESYSVEALADSLPMLVIPFDSVRPHLYDMAYSLPYYAPFEYVALSSAMYTRYLTRPGEFPAQAAFYEGIARRFHEVAAFEPGRDLAGPTVRIFRRRPGPAPRDFRGIDPAVYRRAPDPAVMARFLTALANALTAGAKDDLALAAAEQAVVLAPDDPDALSSVAVLRARRGEYLPALKAYQRALALAPEDAVLNYNLGRLYQRQSLFPEAIESYRRALRYNPRLSEAHLTLAICLVHQNQAPAARAALRRFLELLPADRRAGEARAMLQELERLK